MSYATLIRWLAGSVLFSTGHLVLGLIVWFGGWGVQKAQYSYQMKNL